MRRALLLGLLGLTACVATPPIVTPPPPPQLPPINADGFRPLPSALIIQPCHPRLDGSPRRCIVWWEASNRSWYLGPYDPAPGWADIFCHFHPQRGDVYRSEANGRVDAAPEGCPS